MKRFLALLVCIALVLSGVSFGEEAVGAEGKLKMNRTEFLPDGDWQKVAAFPDWTGRVDDTLAMNSMMSFRSYAGQGTLYVRVAAGVEGFSLYVNGSECDTSAAGEGLYAIDISGATVNGTNTVTVTNIRPLEMQEAVTIYVHYPVVMEDPGSLEGIRPEAVELISDIIESDIGYGFPSAQLAVIKNGRLVINRAWGLTNSYNQDGSRNTVSEPVTTDTMYDLASVTKVFSVVYGVQMLVTEGYMNITDRIVDILGDEFATETLNMVYDGVENPPDYETQVEWKRRLTVKDLLNHSAGFPAGAHYNNPDYDMVLQEVGGKGANVCYARTRSETKAAIFKTPLMYEPGTRVLYSDVDYMLMTFVIEKITGQRIDLWLSDQFFAPLGLSRISYVPLQNGFAPEECAATELNGNTRDNLVYFTGIRSNTLQGEVHDERAWYCMEGISGHAGLFASAADLAKLSTLMLNGGCGNLTFFSRNALDLFTSPQSYKYSQWGMGWQRQGEDQQMWYFGTMADSNTVGHQGWTGTLIMIDPERELIIAYLTNKINSPVVSPERPNHFLGSDFTASTLGFVAQILSIGMDTDYDVRGLLTGLSADMAADSLKLIPEGAGANDPTVLNTRSKIAVMRKWAGDRTDLLQKADEIEAMLPTE